MNVEILIAFNLLKMIDRVNLRSFTENSIAFYQERFPYINVITNDRTKLDEYYWKVKNLKIRYRPDYWCTRKGEECNEIFISHSIHKYAKGDNISDFSLKDVKSTIQWLCVDFKLMPYKIKCTKLEIGVNIIVAKNPNDYLPIFIEYKKHAFRDLRPRGKSTIKCGVVCDYTNYVIKAYNKTEDHRYEMSIPLRDLHFIQRAIRIEIEYKSGKLRTIKQDITAQDLFSQDLMDIMIKEFLKIFNNIEMVNNEVEWNQYGLQEIMYILLVTSPTEYKRLKSIVSKRSSDEKKRLKRWLKKTNDKIGEGKFNLVEEVQKKVHDKIEELRWG